MRKIKQKKVKHPKVGRSFSPMVLTDLYKKERHFLHNITPHSVIEPRTGATLPIHLVYDPMVFTYLMSAEMDDPESISRQDIHALRYLGEQISDLGPQNPNEIRKLVRGYASEDGGYTFQDFIPAAFTSLTAHAFFAMMMWRAMGKNIIELDPYLMDALLRTEINVIPDDLHLPITPIYLAIPPKRLEIFNGDASVDGFILEEVDYEEMSGGIVNEEGEEKYPGKLDDSEMYYYVDNYTAPFMGMRIRYGCVRNLRVTVFRDIPAHVPRDSHFLSREGVAVATFIIPLDYDAPMGDYLQKDERINEMLEGIGALQSSTIWVRTVLNSLLYFNSQGADKKEVAGLTSQQKSKLAGIKNKKARQKFIERNKAPYTIIKIGSSFSAKPVFGKGKPISSRFIVRGHWRKQRHGKGRKQTKLIWIKPFIKGKDLEAAGKTRIYQNPYD